VLLCILLTVVTMQYLLLSCAVLLAVQDPNAIAGKFGFAVDNTIGATPQPNGWMDDWVDFYRERRIRHQLQLLGEWNLHSSKEEPADCNHAVALGTSCSCWVST
jgi:fructosamine-3-kinase